MQAALGNFAGVRIRSRQTAHSSSAAAASEPSAFAPAFELSAFADDRGSDFAREEVDGKTSSGAGAGAGAGDGSSANAVKVVAGIAALKETRVLTFDATENRQR